MTADSATKYFVERILDYRPGGRRYQYLIYWQGYGLEHRSWLPGVEVEDLAALDDFLVNNPLSER